MNRRRTLALLALALALPAAPSRAATPVWAPTLALPEPAAVSAFADGTAYAAYTGNAGEVLLRSTDYGATWEPATDPLGDTAHFRFSSPTHGVAVEFSGAFARRTSDGARTWERTAPYAVGKQERFTRFGAGVHGSTVVVSGELSATTTTDCRRRAAVMISDDRGGRWRRAVLPAPRGVSATSPQVVAAFGSRELAVVAHEYRVECPSGPSSTALYLSHDGGRTFARRAVCAAFCTAVGWVSRTSLVVGRSDGTTTFSTDGGRTFREGQPLRTFGGPTEESVYRFWVQSLVFRGSVGYASTMSGTWRTTDGGRRWGREVSPEASHSGDGWGGVAMFDDDRAIVSGRGFVAVRRLVATS